MTCLPDEPDFWPDEPDFLPGAASDFLPEEPDVFLPEVSCTSS